MKYVNIHIFSQLTWLSQTNCGWRRKTTYTFQFSVKSSIRIRYFSSCAKKKLNFVDQCNWCVASSWNLLSPAFHRSNCFTSVFWNVFMCYLKCDAIRCTASLCRLSNNCNINTLVLELRITLCCTDLCETVVPSIH